MGERAALVTGATGGIGEAIARGLAADGYGLTIAGRKTERLAELSAELGGTGVAVATAAADVREPEGIERIAEVHRDAHRRLDVLVHSAGGGILSPLERLKTRHVDLQLDLNLRSAILLFRACLPQLRVAAADAGRANVVQISSAAGKQGEAGLAVYSAAKHGLVGFTEACNAEFGREGIRSTVFCPGLVDTPLAEAYGRDTSRMIRPDDLADAVRWLVGLSQYCLVPEISFLAPQGRFAGGDPG